MILALTQRHLCSNSKSLHLFDLISIFKFCTFSLNFTITYICSQNGTITTSNQFYIINIISKIHTSDIENNNAGHFSSNLMSETALVASCVTALCKIK